MLGNVPVSGGHRTKVNDVQGHLIALMGVHMYTVSMTLVQPTSLAQGSGKASTVIDWSDRETVALDPLLSWVRNSPAGQRIHVVLPTRAHAHTRLIKNTLQTLGCIVTLRMRIIPRSKKSHV